MRDYCPIWLEAVAQPIEIGQDADIKIDVDSLREIGFTSAVVSERQQSDHDAAGLLLAPLGEQRLEGAPAPTVHSAGLRRAPQNSRRRAPHGHAQSLRTPAGSGRAGDRTAHQRS